MIAAGGAPAGLEIVLAESNPVPGLPGENIDGLGSPVIDDEGRVYFFAGWGVSLNDGGLIAAKNGVAELLFREQTPIAGLGFTPSTIGEIAVSRAGLAAGVGLVVSVTGNTDAILRITDQSVTAVHLDGDPAPGIAGTAFIRTNSLSITRNGRIAYTASLGGTAGGSSDDRALFRFDPASNQSLPLIQEGEPFPEGDGVFGGTCSSSLRFFCVPDMNNAGDAAFVCNGGIFSSNGSLVSTVVRLGGFDPGGDTFDRLSFPRINESGDIAFSADVVGNSSYDAVYIVRNGVVDIAPLGGAAPTSAGGLLGSFRTPISTSVRIDDAGRASFLSDTLEPTPGSSQNRVGEGLFITDGSAVICVARQYEQAPGGPGTYRSVSFDNDWAMSDAGHVLFKASIDLAGGGRTTAVFRYVPGEGTERLVTIGDTIDGRVVDSLSELNNGFASAGAINNDGAFVFRLNFTNGQTAIVRSASDPPCLADLVPNGVLDIDDVLAFLAAFNAGDAAADVAPPMGSLDIDDVLTFLAAFDAGCP